MSRSAENPGPRKGKRGRICIGRMSCTSGVEVRLKLDVRREDIGGESRLVVGD
jgi:hypothetical protein